jgi:hypothetical protein
VLKRHHRPEEARSFFEIPAFKYFSDHEVRHGRMNQPHPARVTPSWYGDSVGHYEGDILVIDTAGIKIGPFTKVDQYGTPHIEALSCDARSTAGSGSRAAG